MDIHVPCKQGELQPHYSWKNLEHCCVHLHNLPLPQILLPLGHLTVCYVYIYIYRKGKTPIKAIAHYCSKLLTLPDLVIIPIISIFSTIFVGQLPMVGA